MNDIVKKLNKLKIEDLIWVIYFFIAAFAILSNYYEKKYIIYKDKNAYKKEKTINVSIFFIAFFIYLYFVLNITDDLSNMEKNFSNSEYKNTFLKLIASLLFLIGGTIFLLQEINGSEPNDIGFI